MSETLSAAEAADLLHLHIKRVQALARAGRLPATRVGRKWLFPRHRLEALVAGDHPATTGQLEISARNQLEGTVRGIRMEGLMAEVRIDVGGQDLTAVITASSASRLELRPGLRVVAIIKSTEIMVGRAR
jgi:molybdate transport system regulatory protein